MSEREMEQVLKCAREYRAGLLSPVEFRAKVTWMSIDLLDRSKLEKFIGVLCEAVESLSSELK